MTVQGFSVEPTELPDVVIVRSPRFEDQRGAFMERFRREAFGELGLPVDWAQDNYARSVADVVRGLHYQIERPQGKLVSVTRGRIWDVAVDIRRTSPTFGRWVGVTLDEDDPAMLYIPPGYAHGYAVLSEVAGVHYKCTTLYEPSMDRGIRWDDATLAVEWPVAQPVLSQKDLALPGFDGAELYDR